MLHEVRMVCELVILAVFENKYSVLLQQLVFKDEVRYLRQFLQSIGRVGKDKVERLPATLDEAEGISTQRQHVGKLLPCAIQLLQAFADETVMVTVLLDTHHLTASP